MTLIVSWAGVDPHGPASIYIAADSRISWPNGSFYDHGRKVFASNHSADIFAYCGDVLFPSMALSQIVDLINAGLLFAPDDPFQRRSDAVLQKLAHKFSKYPYAQTSNNNPSIEIIHAGRDFSGTKFHVNKLSWRMGQSWKSDQSDLPDHSDILFSSGSGNCCFRKRYAEYQNGPNKSTSRNVFHCFCDTVVSQKPTGVGGAPQLVGLIRKPLSIAKTYGIINFSKRYYLGFNVDNLDNFDRIEWRNERFELCDGFTKKRKSNAQSQPVPRIP